MFRLISALLLGGSLGANNAANVFGTAVAARVVKFSVAATLTGVFVIIGAILEGEKGMYTLGGLTAQDVNSAFISSFAAGVTVTLMTYLALPVSTSQAVVGAILGMALATQQEIHWGGLQKVVLCWVGTPIGAMIISYVLYRISQFILGKMKLSIIFLDNFVRWGLIFSGIYGAYTLGANNVANVTGVFAQSGLISVPQATLIGGLTIALGMPFSRRVMMTVGKDLVGLDGFSAFIATLSQAITMHVYTVIGVPVSNSQAIVGAVLGIGIVLGMRTINNRTLINILLGWIGTPIVAGLIAVIMMKTLTGFF